ncbi:MAG: sugar transferase [Solirubrobacteraceae bacterium]|nr:sugar transferase [Patulibacter sp.]
MSASDTSPASGPGLPPADLSHLPTTPGSGPAAGRPIPLVRASRVGRALDLLIAGTVLLLTSPILGLAALAVTRESKGGALYRQRRVGLRGSEFDVIKLRTMVDGAEHLGAGLKVDAGDARITRVGAFLRRTSIDELPNLVNVFRGEMAIVGPRPTVPSQVVDYTDRQLGRLAVRPGITGLAQVSGRASLPWSERIEIDLRYIANRSPRLDLRILIRTALTVFGGAGLYRGDTGGWR